MSIAIVCWRIAGYRNFRLRGNIRVLFGNTAGHDALEQVSKELAVPDPAVAVLREGRVIGDRIGEIEATEPPVGQIEMDFLAQAAFGTDAQAVTDDQHADHQFRIDRGPTHHTVESGQFPPQLAQFDKPVD